MLTLSINRPWLTVIVIFALCTLMALGSSQLNFRGDYRVFFGPDNPELLAFEDMQSEFSKSDNAVLLIAPQSGNVYTRQVLQLIQQLSEQAWQTPYSTRVDSLTNFQYTEARGDELIVDDLFAEHLALNSQNIQARRTIASNDPRIVKALVSNSGHVTAIHITINLPELDKSSEVTEVARYLEQLVAEAKQQHPTIDFHLSGVVMLNYSLNQASVADITSLIPLMLLVIFIVQALVFRSLSATLASLFVVFLSMISTLGLAGWLGIDMSMATVNVPLIVMTLAVADCVHIISASQQAYRHKNKKNAIHQGLVNTFWPVIITSATTALGFLSFNISEVPPIRDLGNMVALGVIIAALLSLFLLPAVLKLLPLKPAPESQGQQLQALARQVIKHRYSIVSINAVVLAFSLYLIPKNEINDVAVKYFSEDVAFRQSSTYMEKNLSGYVFIDFKLKHKSGDSVTDTEFMQSASDFSSWLRTLKQTAYVNTYSDIMKELNKNMMLGEQRAYQLPGNSELASQYLLLYEMSLPYGLDLNNRISIDKQSTRISAIFSNIGSKELLDIEQQAQAWITKNAPDIELQAASPNLMFAHISTRNIETIAIGTLIAFILIAALLTLPLRSLRLASIALLGMLVPSTICFGFWAIYSGEINLGLSIVASMTLGIVVDDIVHLLSKYKQQRSSGAGVEQAIEHSFASVGRALICTTFILASGFLVLTASSYLVNQNLGLLTSAILIVALVIDLSLIPALILIAFKKQRHTATKLSLQTN
ncbi:efflux RND transporter permease subunit [Agaribacterium haliotis]|uniref:efflux RND transporter permease subunit n=1 Tax=Agaribacterium haliotis TaxID=2013869 RepID=UPI000BB52FC9|nr:efflux RND transporter permease subunit [Agaribacterium haliotis]